MTFREICEKLLKDSDPIPLYRDTAKCAKLIVKAIPELKTYAREMCAEHFSCSVSSLDQDETQRYLVLYKEYDVVDVSRIMKLIVKE